MNQYHMINHMNESPIYFLFVGEIPIPRTSPYHNININYNVHTQFLTHLSDRSPQPPTHRDHIHIHHTSTHHPHTSTHINRDPHITHTHHILHIHTGVPFTSTHHIYFDRRWQDSTQVHCRQSVVSVALTHGHDCGSHTQQRYVYEGNMNEYIYVCGNRGEWLLISSNMICDISHLIVIYFSV